MSLKAKQVIIAILGMGFMVSLIFVQYMEVTRRRQEAGLIDPHIDVPDTSRACVNCHTQITVGNL